MKADMKPSLWLASFLRDHERFRPTAYLPTKNDRWTIGFGHTKGVKQGDTCTMIDAVTWLLEDIAPAAAAVNKYITVPLTQHQFDALCSLVFNCGPGPLLATLGHKLNAGDYHGAADEFLRWDRQSGRFLSGLLARRQAECARFLS